MAKWHKGVEVDDAIMGKGIALLIEGKSVINRCTATWVRKFLEEAVDIVDMHILSLPSVHFTDKDHIRGIILLAESHIAIHWDKPFLFLDVFSCKEMDIETTVLWITSEWQLTGGTYTIIKRGWGWQQPELNATVTKNIPPINAEYLIR